MLCALVRKAAAAKLGVDLQAPPDRPSSLASYMRRQLTNARFQQPAPVVSAAGELQRQHVARPGITMHLPCLSSAFLGVAVQTVANGLLSWLSISGDHATSLGPKAASASVLPCRFSVNLVPGIGMCMFSCYLLVGAKGYFSSLPACFATQHQQLTCLYYGVLQ